MKELEMILQALTTLGEAGKEAFIWWLIMEKGLGFLSWIIFCVAVVFTTLKLSSVLLIKSQTTRLRDAMGVGCPGPLLDSELQEMFRWIERHRNK